VANSTIGFVTVFAAHQDPNWHTEFHLVIRDKSTGQVLFSRDGSNTTPVSGHPTGPTAPTHAISAPLSATGGSEAVCEVTGTHTPAARHSQPKPCLKASALSTTSSAARCADLRRKLPSVGMDGLGLIRAGAVCFLEAAPGSGGRQARHFLEVAMRRAVL
jgi:hypothetical protein